MSTARRVGWTVLSVFVALCGLGMGLGAWWADDGRFGTDLIGVTFGLLIALTGACCQTMRGLRLGVRPHRRVRRTDQETVEIRIRRGPEIVGTLILVCFTVMLCQGAGLAFRSGLIILGGLLTLIAIYLVVMVVDLVLTIRMRRAFVVRPDRLSVELGSEATSLAWKDIRPPWVEERVSNANGIKVTTHAIVIEPRRKAESMTVSRRRRIRLLPKKWLPNGVRVGDFLLDHPGRVLDLLRALQKQRDDNARRVVLANDSTMAYLTGEMDVSPLPSGR